MIPLFTEVPAGAQTVSFPPQTDYVMRGLKQNVQQAINYWHAHAKPSRPNLFLTRLLHLLDVPMDLPLARYYPLIDAKALTLSMALKMTSSIYKGQAFEGVFYAAPTVEYLLAVDTPFDADEVHARWQYVEAIEVVTQPKSDLHCVLPTAVPYSLESGLAVIQINIPALAVQYRAFMLSERNNPNGGESTQMFIERYVLPNMLPSQTEVALFNRLYRKVHGEGTHVAVNSHAKSLFQMPFLEGKLDNVLDQVVDNYASVDNTFEKLLRNTPAVFKPDLLEAAQLPELAMTSPVEWLLVASRLKVFDFLLTLCGEGVLRQNQLEVSQLLRTMRDPSVSSQIERIPREAGELLSSYVQHLLSAANKKVY